jgi:hypothetical protein
VYLVITNHVRHRGKLPPLSKPFVLTVVPPPTAGSWLTEAVSTTVPALLHSGSRHLNGPEYTVEQRSNVDVPHSVPKPADLHQVPRHRAVRPVLCRRLVCTEGVDKPLRSVDEVVVGDRLD